MNILNKIEKYTLDTSLNVLYKKDVLEKAFSYLEKVTIMYGGAEKAIISGNILKLHTPYKEKTVLVPCSFFLEKLPELPKRIVNGTEYFSAADAFRKSGKNVVEDGRFIVASDDADAVKVFKRKGRTGVNEYAEIAAYLAKHQQIDYTLPPEKMCAELCERWTYTLVGNENTNDLSNPKIVTIIKELDAQAKEVMGLFIRKPYAKQLFSGDYSKNFGDVSMSCWYKNLLTMAKAYGTYGSSFYHDSSLLSDVLYGLKWMYLNKYGRDKITDDGWGMISKLDWYDWAIASPSALISTMMIVREFLTDKEKADYTAMFDSLRETPYGVGYNCMEYGRIMIGSAALKNNVKKILKIQAELEKPLAFVDNNRDFSIETFLDNERAKYTETKGQGFYTDGSYVYHTLQALNGMYGVSHIERLADYLSVIGGTPFAPTTPMADNIPYWIYNSFEPLLYQTAMFRTFQGRTNFPDCYMLGKRVLIAAMQLLEFTDEEDAVKIKQIIKKHILDTPFVDFYSGLNLSYVKKLSDIITDGSINSCSDISESRTFYHMDKTIHKRENWAFCVSMSSSRIFNYDSICNEGTKNWYMGDGMTEYHIKGEYSNGSLDYWNYINYYKLPGTTVDVQPRKEVSIAQGNEYLSSKSFVGGVSIDNMYGVCAMELESYHNKEDFGVEPENKLIGGKAPKHKCDLTAKKSWFMFDNEVVCLGTDISASENNDSEVITVIDNYKVSGTNNSFYTDGGLCKETFTGKAKWANLDGVCGYYFPDEEHIQMQYTDNEYSGWKNSVSAKEMQKYKTLDFVELWISHGVNPVCGKYNYVLLPGKTKEETAQYADNPDVVVLENNSSVQAVKNKNANIYGYVFWKSGSFKNISVDEPMIIMIKEQYNILKIAFSDPTQSLASATLKIEGKFVALSYDEEVNVCAQNNNITLTIDFEQSRGKSIQATLKTQEE